MHSRYSSAAFTAHSTRFRKHLARYCNEFSYRFNRREEQLQMFGMTVKNLVRGKALPYSKLTEKVSES